MTNNLGRDIGASPSTEFYPFSAATASSPVILITATTATGGGTNIHTANVDKNQDVLFVTVANNSLTALVAYGQLGTTATTLSMPYSISAGSVQVIYSGNASVANGGQFGIWTTATTGLAVTGFIARTYTSTGSF
jgi:hypothetical protein